MNIVYKIQNNLKIEHTDLSIPVYNELKKRILEGNLKPGQKLLQEQLAGEMGVSRTPLLKALQMLEYDYLVESIPRRGMFVKKLSVTEMKDIYDVREGIETVAVRLVVEKITDKQISELKKLFKPFINNDKIDINKYQEVDEIFHDKLVEFSQNPVLKKTYSLSYIKGRIAQMGLMRTPNATLPEHLALIEAIEKRDVNEAVKEITNHIRKSKNAIVVIDEK